MPTLSAYSDEELILLSRSNYPELSNLAAEVLRHRQTLREIRGLLGVYNPNNVVTAYRLTVATVGEE